MSKLSLSDEWATPPNEWNALNERFHFGADLAASAVNTKVPELYFTKERSSLQVDWAELSARVGWLFGNFPFSKPNLDDFTDKVREEVERGARIVTWLPANTSSRWFHRNLMDGGDVVGKCSQAIGLLRGTTLILDHTRHVVELNLLRYRPTHKHTGDAANAAEAENYGSGLGGICIAVFTPKARRS